MKVIRYSRGFKIKLVREAEEEGNNPHQASRKYGVMAEMHRERVILTFNSTLNAQRSTNSTFKGQRTDAKQIPTGTGDQSRRDWIIQPRVAPSGATLGNDAGFDIPTNPERVESRPQPGLRFHPKRNARRVRPRIGPKTLEARAGTKPRAYNPQHGITPFSWRPDWGASSF
jgi:hypothetical protein